MQNEKLRSSLVEIEEEKHQGMEKSISDFQEKIQRRDEEIENIKEINLQMEEKMRMMDNNFVEMRDYYESELNRYKKTGDKIEERMSQTISVREEIDNNLLILENQYYKIKSSYEDLLSDNQKLGKDKESLLKGLKKCS